MLNSVNNSSPSFGASFKYDGIVNSKEKHDTSRRLDDFETRRFVDEYPEKAKGLLDFLKFIQTDEGKEILNKLPDGDVVELSSMHDVDNASPKYVLVEIKDNLNNIHRDAHLTHESTKDQFVSMVESYAHNLEKEKEMQESMSILSTPFTIDEK